MKAKDSKGFSAFKEGQKYFFKQIEEHRERLQATFVNKFFEFYTALSDLCGVTSVKEPYYVAPSVKDLKCDVFQTVSLYGDITYEIDGHIADCRLVYTNYCSGNDVPEMIFHCTFRDLKDKKFDAPLYFSIHPVVSYPSIFWGTPKIMTTKTFLKEFHEKIRTVLDTNESIYH